MRRSLTSTLVVLLALCGAAARAGARQSGDAAARRDPTPLGIPYTRYTTRDRLGREITFYLSAAKPAEARLPLVVFVQGSGCNSLFFKYGDLVAGGIQNQVWQIAANRARVLVVEKPGVRYLDDSTKPGTAEGCSEEFLEEHTLERWCEAVEAAVRAARTLPLVDARRTLVLGHSEGGHVAARVAADDPAVTHVAPLATSGPTQLFDLLEIARDAGWSKESPSGDRDPADEVVRAWRDIMADPTSTKKFFWGHPYRRWSSFLASSTLRDLARSKARVYLAHGTEDRAVPVSSFDVMYAELLAGGRDVTAERIAGGDHGYAVGDKQGMEGVLTRVLAWFLADEGRGPGTEAGAP